VAPRFVDRFHELANEQLAECKLKEVEKNVFNWRMMNTFRLQKRRVRETRLKAAAPVKSMSALDHACILLMLT